MVEMSFPDTPPSYARSRIEAGIGGCSLLEQPSVARCAALWGSGAVKNDGDHIVYGLGEDEVEVPAGGFGHVGEVFFVTLG